MIISAYIVSCHIHDWFPTSDDILGSSRMTRSPLTCKWSSAVNWICQRLKGEVSKNLSDISRQKTFPLLICVEIPLETWLSWAARPGKGHLAAATSHTLSSSVLPAPSATGSGRESALHWVDYAFLILAPSRAARFPCWVRFSPRPCELYWTVLHEETSCKKRNKGKKKTAAKVGVDCYLISAKDPCRAESDNVSVRSIYRRLCFLLFDSWIKGRRQTQLNWIGWNYY